jgi:hypothetical protein
MSACQSISGSCRYSHTFGRLTIVVDVPAEQIEVRFQLFSIANLVVEERYKR